MIYDAYTQKDPNRLAVCLGKTGEKKGIISVCELNLSESRNNELYIECGEINMLGKY